MHDVDASILYIPHSLFKKKTFHESFALSWLAVAQTKDIVKLAETGADGLQRHAFGRALYILRVYCMTQYSTEEETSTDRPDGWLNNNLFMYPYMYQYLIMMDREN